MSVILGLNFFHMDTSACLVADGVLKSVIAQERLGRRLKHDPSFPADSIRHVLAESGVRLADVTHVAVAGDPHSNYRAKVGYVLRRPWHSAGAWSGPAAPSSTGRSPRWPSCSWFTARSR